jgi:hypothetical protein
MSGVVNQTDVCVVWCPTGPVKGARSTLQVTIKVGKNPPDIDRLAVEAFLLAVKRIQDLPRP